MSTNNTPYELIQGHAASPFITFETETSQDSWPWHALQGIHLDAKQTKLDFEFPHHSVEIVGENLGVIESEARQTRLKAVRAGKTPAVTIRTIRIIG